MKMVPTAMHTVKHNSTMPSKIEMQMYLLGDRRVQHDEYTDADAAKTVKILVMIIANGRYEREDVYAKIVDQMSTDCRLMIFCIVFESCTCRSSNTIPCT